MKMYSNILRGTILVVDDDAKFIRFLKGTFEPRGYRVLTALRSDEGIKEVDKWGNEIDLVMLDLRMPGEIGGVQIDGLEALKIIKKKYRDIPVGILTAYADKEKECLDNGAAFFITKPYSLRTLFEYFEKIIKTNEKKRPAELEVEIKAGYIPTAKILIVDDEEVICHDLKVLLESGIENALGEYHVEIAYDGKSGIEKNREFEPDIVIVDIKMQHLNGDEMINIIEKEGPKPKDYFIMTGVDGEEDQRNYRKAGYTYILKPFDENKFCQQLRWLCFKHKLIRPL